VAVLLFAGLFASQPVYATTSITAYKAQTPVTINGVVSPGEWTDTPQVTEPTSGITYAFKQNGTGLLFLLEWQHSSTYCYDKWCFGGIEIANQSNYGEMGSPSTPTIMILLSQGFQKGYDEFISMGDTTPTAVEQDGYATQSVCALNVTNGNYVAECYRPFHLVNASPYDPFPVLVSGSPIEIAFAVGEFSSPGLHEATDMSTYTLALSNQTYSGQATTTTTSMATSSPSGVTTTSQSSLPTTQSTGTGSNWFAGFPGLNLVTLVVFACVALVLGILLGIGVALRARKLVTQK
jgi:hypothetical protein